ncbi:selenide, water dikinase SelD [Nocardioides sp. zg-DK7169]|uniref:selenide, water dikinase SelD n=1 Tax=Nocardioides sp. zg-DK7169 TaxID=2736600 RepID=UPI001552C81C|nr:selenide, water dikinase SelD [Nocardioides sp. zg-DK7169]NPC97783.1 selenide, water dikinase SelD [Nocardioides sp. zg-DK7169]
MTATPTVRLTQYAAGGGCACKVPPGELERVLAGLPGGRGTVHTGEVGELLVGLEHGDDAAAVRIAGGRAVIATADFFTPVVDDAYDWGRIAAANALSDVYAMGGEPVLAVNLLAWPRERIPFELAAEVLRGGAEVALEAGCHLAGGHSIDDPEPKYGLAVTGMGDPDRLLRNDAARPGTPLTLTKPLGLGVLNNRHKATGERFEHAIAAMTTLNRDASRAALAAGCTAATDVTGFGLLGHLYKMARASGVSAVVDSAAVPYLEAARESHAAGHVPGGSVRNLDWVRPHLDASVSEDELVLLADAQTSGGLLIAGEIPGYPVVGEIVEAGEHPLVVR